MPDHPGDDKKVKDLLDAATRAELERWFGLPSFEQLAERGAAARPAPEAEDPQVVAVRKRRLDAIAAVDPAMLEAHRLRVEPPNELIRDRPPLKLNVDPSIARLDQRMVDRWNGIAEPRQLVRSDDLDDDLRDATPQALLRDLHRPELDFQKQFEIVDSLADYRHEIAAIVREVMKIRTRLPPPEASAFRQARALILELRDDRHKPWTDIKMPLRRVTE